MDRLRRRGYKPLGLPPSSKQPHPGFKANLRVFEAQDFIAALCGLLPDPMRHESIACGNTPSAALRYQGAQRLRLYDMQVYFGGEWEAESLAGR